MGKIRFTITFCTSKCGKLLRLLRIWRNRFLPRYLITQTVWVFSHPSFSLFAVPVTGRAIRGLFVSLSRFELTGIRYRAFCRNASKNFLTLIWVEICYYRARFTGCKKVAKCLHVCACMCAICAYVKFARIGEQANRAKKFAFFGSNCSKLFERCKHICKLRKRFQVSNRLAWI